MGWRLGFSKHNHIQNMYHISPITPENSVKGRVSARTIDGAGHKMCKKIYCDSKKIRKTSSATRSFRHRPALDPRIRFPVTVFVFALVSRSCATLRNFSLTTRINVPTHYVFYTLHFFEPSVWRKIKFSVFRDHFFGWYYDPKTEKVEIPE